MTQRWREEATRHNAAAASFRILRELGGFLRDSTPERRRSRYGDMEYDWEHRVNTTSGSVGWRERLLGVFHSPYQPTEAALFREMIDALPIDYSQFVYVDIGSGKGRTLLMASEYPFRKVVGVELLPGLHAEAQKNAAEYPLAKTAIETICMDATEYAFPDQPLVVYLFHPLPEAGLQRMIRNLEDSLRRVPRETWLVYHNPLLEAVLENATSLIRVMKTSQYVIYRSRGN